MRHIKVRGLWQNFKKQGFDTFTIDINKNVKPDLVADMLELTPSDIMEHINPTVFWASPPCTTFSRTSIGYHWTKKRQPKTAKCKRMVELISHTMDLIDILEPTYWFIENPRGMIKDYTVMKDFKAYLHNITYCQYGEEYMKPSYIYTNAPISFKKPCKEGRRCHKAAPAGSRKGVQGLKDNFERSILPKKLCEFISVKCSKLLNSGSPQLPTLNGF